MLGKMCVFLALMAGAGLVAFTPAILAEDDCGDDVECSGDPAVIKQLRVEINFLNLVNGLHLTLEQMEALLEGARENRRLRETYLGKGKRTKTNVGSSREQYEALLELKKKLERGENPDGRFLKRLKARFDRAAPSSLKPFKPDRGRYTRELRALEKRIEAVLLNSQKDVISTYKPCLLPPKNLKDPVRVGQASSHSRVGKMLDRLRKLPEDRWERMGEAILSKALEAWEERHGKFPEEERWAEIVRVLAVVDESRKLTEIEYQMSKEDLAKRGSFTNRKDELKAEFKHLVKEKADPPGMVASTLLDPRIIHILERRLKQAKGFRPDEVVDLEKIKGTDAKNGKCGTKYED